MVIESNSCSSAECVGDQLLQEGNLVSPTVCSWEDLSHRTAHGFPKKPIQNVQPKMSRLPSFDPGDVHVL